MGIFKQLKSYVLSLIFLIPMYLLLYPGIIKYYWYKTFDFNESVKFLEIDQLEIRTYKGLISTPYFPKKANLIYTNSRISYYAFKMHIPLIKEIQNIYGKENLNFIYTAQGLESHFDAEIEWFNNMKEFNMHGYHVSLSDNFEDYHDLWRTSKTSEGTTSEFPIFLLMDSSGVKIDTVFSTSEKEKNELFLNLDKLIKPYDPVRSSM